MTNTNNINKNNQTNNPQQTGIRNYWNNLNKPQKALMIGGAIIAIFHKPLGDALNKILKDKNKRKILEKATNAFAVAGTTACIKYAFNPPAEPKAKQVLRRPIRMPNNNANDTNSQQLKPIFGIVKDKVVNYEDNPYVLD